MTNKSDKETMSTSYKFVFLFSIFMVFFVLIAGAVTHSKSSGFGLWVWGYTAWLMYKRRNTDLVSMYKLLLWFDGLAMAVLAISVAFNSSMLSVVGVEDLIATLILLVIVLLVTFSLYLFFKSQLGDIKVIKNEDSVQDECWSKALSELNSGNLDDATWARCFAESNGDESKAKASYLKSRAIYYQSLAKQANVDAISISTFNHIESNDAPVIRKNGNFLQGINWTLSNVVKGYLVLCVVVFLGVNIYEYFSNNPTSSITKSSDTDGSKKTSLENVNDGICYVYWDGWKFIKGKLKDDGFITLGVERYGIEVLRLSLPKKMAQDGFGINEQNASKVSVQDGDFAIFFKNNIAEISRLCSFK